MSTPLQDALEDLHARLSVIDAGTVATYIPELGKADPDSFAISIATVDGHVYAVGDAETPFTIQSISKPFVYGLALDGLGTEAVLDKVGVEPSGEAFNAISLESDTGRPRNPMINAGAIATASLVTGPDQEAKLHRTLEALSRFAGRPSRYWSWASTLAVRRCAGAEGSSLSLSAATTARAISSCTAKTSARARS